MHSSPEEILRILDACADARTFPMLDNGYLYLAASRLSAFGSEGDWALVIEIFGHSPRSGAPDLHVHTFASRLHDRKTRADFVSEQAYDNYVVSNPNNESRFFFPVIEGPWDDDSFDYVAEGANSLTLREMRVPLPTSEQLAKHGIEPESPPRIHIFELCRYLATLHRDLAGC